jgi:hypothetical protein
MVPAIRTDGYSGSGQSSRSIAKSTKRKRIIVASDSDEEDQESQHQGNGLEAGHRMGSTTGKLIGVKDTVTKLPKFLIPENDQQ